MTAEVDDMAVVDDAEAAIIRRREVVHVNDWHSLHRVNAAILQQRDDLRLVAVAGGDRSERALVPTNMDV